MDIFLFIIDLFARLFFLMFSIFCSIMTIEGFFQQENFTWKMVYAVFSVLFIACSLAFLLEGIIYFNII